MAVLYDYTEEVIGTEPFEGRFTFTVDGDELVVTADENLTVAIADS